MNKIYSKNELAFSLLYIIIYVSGASIADELSVRIGVQKSVTVIFLGIMSLILIGWIRKNDLAEKYGLCRGKYKAKDLGFYIPLIILSSCNLWYGVRMNMTVHETLLYVASMVFVGFLEELIFRGFLFVSMSKDSVRSAIIVSSLTFGIGHIVNLFNGSGAGFVENMCQVFSAVALGFLFVIIFCYSGTMIPCILTHISINVLSAFADESSFTSYTRIFNALIISAIALWYAFMLVKKINNERIKK